METLKLLLFLFIIFFNVANAKGTEVVTSSNNTGDDGSVSEYDYDASPYYDYYGYNESDNEISLTFRKCVCSEERVWNGTQCLQMEANQSQTIISRLAIDSGAVVHLNISSAAVENCLGVELVLSEGSFYFLNDREIHHVASDLVFGMDSFCLEFTGDEVTLREIVAHACLPPPAVPICCQIPHKCPGTFSSTVTIGESVYPVDTDNLQYSQSVQCSLGKTKHEAPLEPNSAEIHLSILQGQTHLVWNAPQPLNMLFAVSNGEYCIEDKGSTKQAHFCYADPIMEEIKKCNAATCVRKCCPEGFLYVENEPSCVATNKTRWSPSFIDPETQEPLKIDDLILLYGHPWCSHHGLYLLDGSSPTNKNFHLTGNGSLYEPLSQAHIDSSKFCLERFLDSEGHVQFRALVCFENSSKSSSVEKCKAVRGILYPMLIIISCAFLFITLMVYASVPELYANLHGKSLLSHVTSLLIAYVCQVIISWSVSTLSMVACKLIALGTQISFLWAFFWLNVMCFDIWWTLKSMSPSPESGESSRRRFMLYSVYAWGCPLVIGLVTAIMEFVPQLDANSPLILPGFGVRGCWFQDVKSTWLYFHGFTLLLYVFNIFFFFHVAAILIISQRLTEGILRITRKQYKERVFLYLKLFVVMGVTWVCEVASWQEGTCEYWVFTDIVNSLQGMFLFLIFMCNKKVFQKIHAKATPVVRRVKSLFKSESAPNCPAPNTSSSSQRTTQTSLESSSRRMSSSSLNTPAVEISLKAVGEEDNNFGKTNKFY